MTNSLKTWWQGSKYLNKTTLWINGIFLFVILAYSDSIDGLDLSIIIIIPLIVIILFLAILNHSLNYPTLKSKLTIILLDTLSLLFLILLNLTGGLRLDFLIVYTLKTLLVFYIVPIILITLISYVMTRFSKKKIKIKSWNELKFWQKRAIKGLIIGSVVGLVLFFLSFDNDFLYKLSGSILINPICYFFGSSEFCTELVTYFGVIFFPLYFGTIGALIGLIIGKVKGK